MSLRRVSMCLFAPVFCLLGLVADAGANIIVTLTENTLTNQTTVVAAGGLDTALFGAPLTGNFGGGTYVAPIGGDLGIMSSPAPANHYYMAQPFILPYGSGFNTFGTFTGPDIFMLNANGSNPDQLRLPANYVSGAPISASGVIGGTFATLGITPSTVVMNLPDSQTITLQFASVPEPAAGLLLMLGAAVVGLRRRG